MGFAELGVAVACGLILLAFLWVIVAGTKL